MPKKKIVTIYKTGNMLMVHPTSDAVFAALRPELSFTESKQYFGPERKQRIRAGKAPFENIEHNLFELDTNGRVATAFGFWRVIRDKLRAEGYQVNFKDNTPTAEHALTPDWDALGRMLDSLGYKLRDNQPEFVKKILTNRCGRIDCPPGFGKTFMIGVIAALLPKARIDVVTRRAAVLKERIYPELVSMVGDVGIICSTKKQKDCRVMCLSAGSLGHARADADILFGDECHELGADRSSAALMRWQSSRNFGLSASHERPDGKDLRCEGIFGPIIMTVDYATAEGARMVVPIKILWSSVVMDYDPASGIDDPVTAKRLRYWTNDFRNSVIAEDAKKYDDDTQVLITVETLEHAMNLKRLLPEFSLVHMENGLSGRDRTRYIQAGCINHSEPDMTIEHRAKLTKDFESGKLKKVIATTVWNVGVSFNSLEVLIRADGGGSPINDIQIPGRVSRTASGKEFGAVHDYADQFSRSSKMRASRRAKSYEKQGWDQTFPRASMLDEYLSAKTSFKGK